MQTPKRSNTGDSHGSSKGESPTRAAEIEHGVIDIKRELTSKVLADASDRAKHEFLATMSHEFRTPLNAIVGYAQLLDMGVLGPMNASQHAHLERLQASARHLLQLVDDVLDVAKVNANRLEVRRDPLVTGAAVAAAVAIVHPLATAKGVRLLDLHVGETGFAYLGDEHRVRQILVNLLSNAVKFTEPGGQVTIQCGSAAELDPGAQPGGAGLRGADYASSSAGDPWCFIRVEDTGRGIAPELMGRLFEPFVQGDGALTRDKGGTGLGLAISRRLAQLMGGDLTVRSQHGAGAAFSLWLPANQKDGRRTPPLPTSTASDGAASDGAARHHDVVATVPAEDGVPANDRLPAPPSPALPGRDAFTVDGSVDAAVYPVLMAISVRLATEAEAVAIRYVAALRRDGTFPGARDLPEVQLRDHVTPLISLLASHLMIIGETRGEAPELLGDGSQVQRLMAELHGAQRQRLGWSEADIQREVPLLRAEIERVVRGVVDTAPTADIEGVAENVANAVGDGSTDSAGSKGVTQTAVRYVLGVTRHVLERATRTTLRAYRFAKAADSP